MTSTTHPDDPTPPFGGETFDPELDGKRLAAQFERVRDFMLDGRWHTYAEIGEATPGRTGLRTPEASISARIRDLRKEAFGGYTVERRRRAAAGPGIWEYRLLPPSQAEAPPPAPEPPAPLPAPIAASVPANTQAVAQTPRLASRAPIVGATGQAFLFAVPGLDEGIPAGKRRRRG